ncbi:MAG: 50S ribosomal protein L13 [Opitutales bacterium]|nr:50S ribosomal protein L13 [Opitutales bacterium]
MKTTVAKVAKKEDQQWYVVDANDLVLGRLAVKIANVLRGRYKPTYTPHVDCGDHVIVINAEKIRVTGKKETDKEYMFYTGYVGGEKYVSLAEFRKRRPEFIIENAVRGMMPKNKLASQMLKKLHVYAGAEHPHSAQQPKPFNF